MDIDRIEEITLDIEVSVGETAGIRYFREIQKGDIV